MTTSTPLITATPNRLTNPTAAETLRLIPAVSVVQNNGHVEINVEDTGPGLSAKQQEHLFEAFYTTKTGGTGLGLAVTKTLLEKIGASIASGNGSRGARFRLVLPSEHKS